MELRQLRYFVAVAEELHFTRAAERLGIKQPSLSSQIRQLEREMGTSLFHRLTRGVELTEAGAQLLDEARRILDQAQRTRNSIRHRARGEAGHLRLGFASATYLHRIIVPGVMRGYRDHYPGVTISAEQQGTPQLAMAVRKGEIDVAFIRPPLGDSDGLVVELLIEEPMLVVLPRSHARAGDGAIALAAISRETFILPDRTIGPGLHDAIIASCQRAGFAPKLGQKSWQIPSSIYLVAGGFGVAIVPGSVEQIRAEGVAYLRIEGEAPRAPISLAFRRDNHSAVARNFVAVARRTVRLLSGKEER